MDQTPPDGLSPEAQAPAEPLVKPPRPARKLPGWLRAWPVYLLLVAVLGVTYYVTRQRQASGQADPILPAVVNLEQNIEIQFSDVVMQGRQKGTQRWIIEGSKVALSKDGRYTYFDPDPKGRFLNLKDWKASEEKPSDKVRAMDWKSKKARFDSFTEDLDMDGDAVITTDEQDVIKTERVEYKSRLKKVVMPKPVTIDMKDNTDIKADSLEANTDAEIFELKGHVDFKAEVNGTEEKL